MLGQPCLLKIEEEIQFRFPRLFIRRSLSVDDPGSIISDCVTVEVFCW
jgi:hypothetical protein